MRRQRGGCWRLRWLWKGRTARRRRGAAGWTGKPCATGCIVTMPGGLRACRTARHAGRTPYLSAAQKAELSEIVRAGPDPEVDRVVRWRRIDLKHLIKERFGVVMHERTVGKQLAELGFRRLSVRPAHPQSDPAAQAAFKKKLRAAGSGGTPPEARGKPLEIWFQDEARIDSRERSPVFGPGAEPARARHVILATNGLTYLEPSVRNAPLPPPSSCPLPIRRR